MTAIVRVKRTYRGVYLSGRRRYVTVKWLRPGVRTVRSGIWQWQVGRLLVRLSWTLKASPVWGRCDRCGT